MLSWMLTSWTDLLMVLASAVGMYVALILFTRLGGLRSFSKLSSFDFAMTVAIGSVIASAVLAPSPPLLLAAVGLAAIYVLQIGVAALRERMPLVARLVDNDPLLIMAGPDFLHENMRKAKVTEADVWAKLREANVLDLAQVRAVVLESTGDVNVLHGPADGVRLQPDLLTGVRGTEVLFGDEPSPQVQSPEG